MIDREKVIELNKAGKTCQEIKDIIGGSLTTIRKYIKEPLEVLLSGLWMTVLTVGNLQLTPFHQKSVN